jgi:hypothetical protein
MKSPVPLVDIVYIITTGVRTRPGVIAATKGYATGVGVVTGLVIDLRSPGMVRREEESFSGVVVAGLGIN